MLPGETVGTNGIECADCETRLALQVCHSAAGYYLGYECPKSGPYSRESDYFQNREDAENALANPELSDSLRTEEYKPGLLEVIRPVEHSDICDYHRDNREWDSCSDDYRGHAFGCAVARTRRTISEGLWGEYKKRGFVLDYAGDEWHIKTPTSPAFYVISDEQDDSLVAPMSADEAVRYRDDAESFVFYFPGSAELFERFDTDPELPKPLDLTQDPGHDPSGYHSRHVAGTGPAMECAPNTQTILTQY